MQLVVLRQVNCTVENTGHSVVISLEASKPPLNVTGGPLSYHYQLTEAHLHYGASDHVGSEHTIKQQAFPAEVSEQGQPKS